MGAGLEGEFSLALGAAGTHYFLFVLLHLEFYHLELGLLLDCLEFHAQFSDLEIFLLFLGDYFLNYLVLLLEDLGVDLESALSLE